MQHLEVSGAVRHIYIYVIRRLKVNIVTFRAMDIHKEVLFNKKHCTCHLSTYIGDCSNIFRLFLVAIFRKYVKQVIFYADNTRHTTQRQDP